MTCRNFVLVASASFLASCVVRNQPASSDPGAGEYDDYHGEGQGGSDADTAGSGDKPKPRTVVGSRTPERRKGVPLKLASKKPPRDPDAKPAPSRKPLPKLGIAGFLPTAAGPGSVVRVHGGGFAPKPAGNKVSVGGVSWTVAAGTKGVLQLDVPDGAKAGVIEISAGGRQTGSTNQFFPMEARAFGLPAEDPVHGLVGHVYDIGEAVTELPSFDDVGDPLAIVAVDELDIESTEFAGIPTANGTLSQWYGIHFKGSLNVLEAGEYDLCVTSDDGSQLYINETLVVDNDGVHEVTEECALVYMEPGEYQTDLLYFQGTEEVALQWTWAKDGGDKTVVPADALFPPDDVTGFE